MAKTTKQEFVSTFLKEELAEAIGEKVRVTNELSSAILGAVAGAYKRAIVEGQNDVGFDDLGTFKVSVREARTYRNPQTGEDIDKPEQLQAKLSLSKGVKEALATTPINE